MSRPVKIYEASWEIGVTLDELFNPWELYFEDARVLARIANFKNLTCDLKLKFLINGNPFYHGCVLAAYQPLPANDERTNMISESYQNAIQMSQMPHVYLNPTHSTGGDIVAPFVFWRNAVNVQAKEWRALGNVRMRDIGILNHANNGTNPITISVFAMAENVKLTMPTAWLFNEGDEYQKPSHIAHTVAKQAGYLSEAPIIGPYARATQMIASGFGNMAALFGYSKVRKVEEAVNMRPRYASNISVANVEDNLASLALDAKKEVTIDPRVVGLPPSDEMALVPLAMRESLVTSFPWDGTNATDTHLFSIRVNPMTGDRASTQYYLTPSAWVCLPFKYWKGSMNFRFSILASAYHRGRLRFAWDPMETSAELATQYNTAYSSIVDISECNDVNIRIGWGADTNYLPVGGLLSMPDFTTVGDDFIAPSAFANGTLSVYVVNELTAPAEPVSPVDILVFTRMCEDFEVACPDASAFQGTQITRVTPVEPPIIPPDQEPADPDPPIPPDSVPDDSIPFSISPPFTASAPIFQPTLAGRFVYPDTGTRRPTSNGGRAGFRVSFEQEEPGNIVMQAAFTPPSATPGTYSVVGNFRIDGGSIVTSTGSFTYTSGNPALMTFTWNVPQLKGEATIEFVFPNTGLWLAHEVVVPRAFGVYKWWKVGIRSLTTGSTATVTDVEDPDSGDDGIEIDYTANSDYLRLDLESTSNYFAHRTKTPVFFLVDGTSGNGFYVIWEYDDETVSSPLVSYPVPFAIPEGYKGILMVEGPPVPIGKLVVAMRLYPINSTVNNIRLYSFSYFRRPYLVNEAAEYPMLTNQGDEQPMVAAPESQDITASMGPSCVGEQANSIHFGEIVTSWRQCLKRYTKATNFLGTTGGFILSDANDFPAGSLPAPGLNIMDYIKSGYVCQRGGIRAKMIMRPLLTSALPLNGECIISRLSDISIRRGTDYDTGGFTFAGSTWEPMNLTNMVDAEIPYYSNLRFHPARLGSDTPAKTWADSRAGRERLWFGVSYLSNQPCAATLLKAAAEDYSLHFFLCTPILEVP